MPAANCWRTASPSARAAFRLTSWQAPSESRFSFPPIRYLQRHHRPGAGLISSKSPPLSNNLCGLTYGLAAPTARSVKGMKGQLPFGIYPLPPRVAPSVGTASPVRERTYTGR